MGVGACEHKDLDPAKGYPADTRGDLPTVVFDLRPMMQTLSIIGTIPGGYSLLYSLEFAWKFLDPRFDAFRSDPRFTGVLRKGLAR